MRSGGFLSVPAPDAAAASSPAPDSSTVLASLSDQQREDWRKTGTLPEPSSDSTSPAASSAAPPGEAGSTDPSLVAAASEAAPPAKKGADTRKAELAAEIQDLLRQRAELRRELTTPTPAKPDVPAASSPAIAEPTTKPTWSTFESQIGTTFETWAQAQDAFADARDAWKDTQLAQQQQRIEGQRQVETVYKTAAERVAAFKAADPDRWAAVAPDVAALTPLSVAKLANPALVRTPEHDIAEVIVTSEFTPHWMLYLSEHPEVFQALKSAPNPETVYRRMGQIEATFAPAQASADPPKGSASKTVSSAPPPPPTLPTRASAPVDDLEAAIKDGDVRRYFATANAREIAGRR